MLRLGVDVGGTFIKAGVVDESCAILHKVSVPTGGDAGFDTSVQHIAHAAELAAQEAGLQVKDLASIGIGIPGLLNPRTGVVVLKLLLSMARDFGKTIVIVTHNQNISKMADVVIRVKNGKIREVTEQENPLSADEVEW